MSGAHPSLPDGTLRVVEIHSYRVPRERWELMILRARQSGANGVSAYIPWLHHEPRRGEIDLTGATLPERDIVGFIELCIEAGLGFIAKPGPFCDSEMLGGGVPTWLIEERADLWAIRHDGEPYRHGDSGDPRLSYDAPGHHEEAARWLRAVGSALAQFEGRGLWAIQIDNETPGDGMWIHEDDTAPSPLRADFASVDRFRTFLSDRYGSVAAVNDSWRTTFEAFEAIDFPPTWSAPSDIDRLRPWLDLDSYADHQMAQGLSAFAGAIRSELPNTPLFHDWLCMPWRLSGMLIEPGVMSDTCGWVGQNVYAEDVDPASMIAGTAWYKMNDVEYIHHAWWRSRLAASLSPAGYPHLVPEISARQDFYLQCCLIGGMDAPCVYMLHSTDPEPEGIGAFQRWAEEAPVLPDGTVLEWWWNMRCLFLCLEAGDADLVSAPLEASIAIAYDHAGERAARFAGVIDGAGFPERSELGAISAASNTSAAGMDVARRLVDAGVVFDVVDASRTSLDRYDTVIVPDVRIMGRAAQAALAAHRGVVLAGASPALDEDMAPLDLLRGTNSWEPPAPCGTPGIDVGTRAGSSGYRYVTVVNRTAESWSGALEGVSVSCGPASVTWLALDGNRVMAAMLHGDDASVGDLGCSQGQAAVALLDGAWHVVSQERAWITIPDAAGSRAWRVTLQGKIFDVGLVPVDGRIRFVHRDDLGDTDRYVLGERSSAERVAAMVGHFQLTTLRAAERECHELAVQLGTHTDETLVGLAEALRSADIGAVGDSMRRLRSAVAAGSGPDGVADVLNSVANIMGRVNDLRLGES